MSALQVMILLSIVVAIGLGFKLKINVGLFALIFSYIFGVFVMGLPVNTVIGMWPTRLFFQIMCVSFFYGFAEQNGTLEKIARVIVYSVRERAWFIPIALFFLCAFLAGIGPGSLPLFFILPPIIMRVADEGNFDPTICAIVLCHGAGVGAWSPVTLNTTVVRTIMENVGFTPVLAAGYINDVWRISAITHTAVFVVTYLLLKGYKAKAVSFVKPDPFTREQKLTCGLIGTMITLLVVPPILEWSIGASIFTTMRAGLDITYLGIILGVTAVLLKLGDLKTAIDKIPWNTVIMLCGVGVLIAIATQAGAINVLSAMISENVAAEMIPYYIILVAGTMSFFSSTLGVVIPTLFPIVFTITAAIPSIAPGLLFGLISVSAGSTGISPFSTIGAMTMAASLEEKREALFTKLLIFVVISWGTVFVVKWLNLVW